MREEVSVARSYGNALVALGSRDERVWAINADLMYSMGSDSFAREFPGRSVQVGVAEQNMIGIAAGLASCGRIPFAHTFAVFASRRACDQVAMSVAMNRFNVKICGAQCGLTSGLNGGTHQALEDVAIMRALPHMTVVDPADTLELEQAVAAIAVHDGPVYLRMPRGTMPRTLPEDYSFVLGKAALLREGTDLTLVSSGIMSANVLDAAELLAREGIGARVLNVSTLKPLDRESIVRAAEETGALVTVENHTLNGGLGSAVAEVIVEECPVPVQRIGVRDRFGETAVLDYLFKVCGMAVPDIVAAARRVLERKQARRLP